MTYHGQIVETNGKLQEQNTTLHKINLNALNINFTFLVLLIFTENMDFSSKKDFSHF